MNRAGCGGSGSWQHSLGILPRGGAADAVSEDKGRKPAFAEGWNRRATAYYLAEEFDKSIADCREVLKRNRAHFGALSGLGQIYTALERYEDALDWFRRALAVNPNMAGVEANIREIEQRLRQRRRNSV